jgi:hypothetical protein
MNSLWIFILFFILFAVMACVGLAIWMNSYLAGFTVFCFLLALCQLAVYLKRE